jgi:hypothetical protein
MPAPSGVKAYLIDASKRRKVTGERIEVRDIALRCPRPRRAGGTSVVGCRCAIRVAPLYGADGAARRPYLSEILVPFR